MTVPAPHIHPRLSIGIAGAGIGGLAAAVALRLAGHSVTVFDQFDNPRPVGSGLVVQPVGLHVLDLIGCGPAVRGHGQQLDRLYGFEPRRGVTTLDVRYASGRSGRFGLGIHRGALFGALYKQAEALGNPVTLNAQIVGIRRDGTKRAFRFADGGQSTGFDLIVDALGLHSALSPIVSHPLPYGALWTTLGYVETSATPLRQLSQRYEDARKMVGVLPIGTVKGDATKRAAFFWSLRGDAYQSWRAQPLADWKREVAQLWPALTPYLAQITSHEDLTFARYAHGTLRRPYQDGVVHIGDAAHRASPQLGQGANMALLDALALTLALDAAPLSDAPALYARMRRGHVRVFQGLSRFLTPQYQHDSTALAMLRDRVIAPVSRIWPVPRVMALMASGLVVPPIGGMGYAQGQPVAPYWALDDGAPEW